MAKTFKGIDVSQWQGIIDWSKVAKQVDYAILRIGYGRSASQVDKQFTRNYTEATKNKIPVGGYWYNYAETVDDAKNEAAACIKVLESRKFDYPIFYDIEESAVLKLGKTKVSAIAEAFLSALESAGYKVGIYSMASALNNSIGVATLNKYDVWVAHVGVNAPAFSKPYTMWQNTWTAKIDGIGGNVDADICYKEYVTAKEDSKPTEKPAAPAKTDADYNKAAEDTIAGVYGNGAERTKKLEAAGFDAKKVQELVNKKLAEVKPVTPTQPAETLASVALDVIAGKYGNGVARIQALTAKGYNATNVQQAVNAILSGRSVPWLPLKGKSIDELAKEVIAGKWGNGDARKRALEAAGYNYAQVQARVNALLK